MPIYSVALKDTYFEKKKYDNKKYCFEFKEIRI